MGALFLPLVLVLGLLAIGMPIFLVLGSTALILYSIDGRPLIIVAQKAIDAMNSGTLMSVTFFVMAAVFMERGGVARALVDFAAAMVGGLRGGLGLVCVLACTMFAAVSGSSVATALAITTILLPAMRRHQYEEHFSLGIIAASGTLGILIPPSLAMVLFGVIAEESIPRLFLAGVVPGVIQAALFAAWVIFYTRRKNYQAEAGVPLAEMPMLVLRTLPALAIPLIIVVGLYGGLVTVTESAALAALAALLVAVFVYRGFTLREVPRAVAESVVTAGAIMLIIAMALAFGQWITESGGPTRIVTFLTEIQLPSWAFLLIINIVILILGMFLEVASILLITMPLIVPLLGPLGIDKVHFAAAMMINMELALITPPVGLNLYVMASASGSPVTKVIRGTVPFIIILAILLGLVTYVPAISLWLPNLVFGG